MRAFGSNLVNMFWEESKTRWQSKWGQCPLCKGVVGLLSEGGIDEKVVILFFYLKTNKVVKVRKNKKLLFINIFIKFR